MSDRSLASLLSHLDYLGTKGLMPKNSVAGRKAACSKVLGILDPEEQSDVATVDIDDVMKRFINLEGRSYNPSSLGVYRSRVASSIADFLSYLDNPSGYKPQNKKKNGSAENAQKPIIKKTDNRKKTSNEITRRDEPMAQPSANVFPIPIRSDVVVRIHNLPFDLSQAEAAKIADVVKAMALKTN
jgi:hypothetical protein